MKKTIFIIGIFLFFININLKVVNAQSSDSLVLNNVGEIINCFSNNNNYLLTYENKCVYYFADEEILIDGSYINHLFIDNQLFVLAQNEEKEQKLYNFDKNKLMKEIIISSDYHITKMVYKNGLILFGYTDSCGIILLYNTDLKEIRKYNFGENNHLKIKDVVIDDNNWILSCTKDAHSLDGTYQNIGNFGETKACLIKLNEKFQQTDIYYLNKFGNFEDIVFIDKNGNNLYFVLESNNQYFYYELDAKFTTLKELDESKQYNDIIFGYNGEFLKIENEDEFKLINKDIIYKSAEKVIEYYIKDGVLNLNYVSNNNIYHITYDEYHIVKLKPFKMGFNYGTIQEGQELNDTDNVVIKSYFSPVSVTINSKVINLQPGEYDLELLVKRPNLDIIKISNKLFVDYYVNVTNNNVYCTGLVLNFLGQATLNGEPIVNGHYINLPGKYQLITTNEFKEKVIINFQVVDDYYIRNISLGDADYNVLLNSSPYLNFKLPIDGVVSKVVIDSVEQTFIQDGNNLQILYDQTDKYEIKESTIEYLIIDDIKYVVNQKFSVKVLKHLPFIDIVEQESDTFALTVNIDDEDKAIKYLKICQDGNSSLVDYNYLKQGSINIPNYIKEGCLLELYLCYDLGTGQIFEQKILSIDGKYKNGEIFEIEPSFNNDELNQIRIRLKDKNIKKLNYLSFGTNDVTNTYAKSFNYNNLIISGVITLIIIIFLIIYSIIKKKKTPSI